MVVLLGLYINIEKTQKKILIKQQAKWKSTICDTSLNELVWKTIYKQSACLNIETRIRSFQIKLNLRAIVTNEALFYFDIKDSPLCTFCKTDCETLYHIFCKCTITDLFWENVVSWMSASLRIPIVITDCEKLFGLGDSEAYSTVLINFILLSARYTIYKCKYGDRHPTLLELKNLLLNQRKSEFIIAKKTNLLCGFYRKWSSFS